MHPCQQCGELISNAAFVCLTCGARLHETGGRLKETSAQLDTVHEMPPLAPHSLISRQELSDIDPNLIQLVVVLLIGCLAGLAGWLQWGAGGALGGFFVGILGMAVLAGIVSGS
jgi:hypothetical protein